jgi:hypothetical protein
MQPTEQQVQRSLEALHRRGGPAVDSVGDEYVDCRLAEVPSEVFARLLQAPVLRPDRLEQARRRLERGDTPSAEALAERMIGRLVCDRLR